MSSSLEGKEQTRLEEKLDSPEDAFDDIFVMTQEALYKPASRELVEKVVKRLTELHEDNIHFRSNAMSCLDAVAKKPVLLQDILVIAYIINGGVFLKQHQINEHASDKENSEDIAEEFARLTCEIDQAIGERSMSSMGSVGSKEPTIAYTD